MERDAEYSRFAGRILLTYVYEETLGWDIVRDGIGALKAAHRARARHDLRARREDRPDRPAAARVRPRAARRALDPTADLDFDFLGLQTLYDRYLIVDKTGAKPRRIEAPQLFWLRVAMGVCLAEPEATARRARSTSTRSTSQRRFCSSTPTLFNAGTLHSQLSSCYLYNDRGHAVLDRRPRHRRERDVLEVGGRPRRLVDRGARHRRAHRVHQRREQGVVPFLKLHNDQLVAVNQGGKRAGLRLRVPRGLAQRHPRVPRAAPQHRRRAPPHARHEHGVLDSGPVHEARRGARDVDAVPLQRRAGPARDLRRGVRARATRSTSARVAAGELHGETLPALELWKQMLKMLFETGHPWLTFKDPCNVRSPQDHAGVIHSSNLCTEITLNTGADETAVCNLGSIVLDQHLHGRRRARPREAARDDPDRRARAGRRDRRQLLPDRAGARRRTGRHRPVGLGVMGLQYALYRRGRRVRVARRASSSPTR